MDGEDPPPRLNLRLRRTPEFLAKIKSILDQDYPCPHQQMLPDVTEDTKTPPETPKSLEKQKALNFPASKITIGQWTYVAVYPQDIKAKCYFAQKKLIWEMLDNVKTGTEVARLKRKIEINWTDILSLRTTFNPQDETGTLEVQLGNRPTFFVEINPQARKHTKWKRMYEDFTLDQAASKCRRHTLHFAPGVLQKNFEKIVSSDRFWAELVKVPFPATPPSFDIGSNLSRYGHSQTLNFNVNNDILRYDPRGLRVHVPDGEVNFNMATPFYANDGRQMNSSFVQDNRTLNQLPGTQVIQPSSQLNQLPGAQVILPSSQLNQLPGAQVILPSSQMNQFPGTQVIQPNFQLINRGSYLSGSQYNNPMSQMINTGELRGSQALTDTYSMLSQHMNEIGPYPYPQGYFVQGETQNVEHTHMDGSFQTNGRYFNNNDCSMPPDF